MVGDRLLTDVVFGNLHGMFTVRCAPLCTGSENRGDNLFARATRAVETAVYYRTPLRALLKPPRHFASEESFASS